MHKFWHVWGGTNVLICNMHFQTSNSATFLLFELAKHPELQDKLYHEITSVMGGNRPHPSWDDIQQMKLVRNSVKETMRLYPPVGVLLRVLNEDAILNGYHVPAGVSGLRAVHLQWHNQTFTWKHLASFVHPRLCLFWQYFS